MKMIDIHAHILPGIDDGAQDICDTLEMAAMAAECGVTAIVATPHCNIPGVCKNYFGEEYQSVFYAAKRAISEEGISLELYPGMEVFATYDLPKLLTDGKIMPINGSHYVLMEFSFDEDPEFADRLLEEVCETGAKPVIAHVERYRFVQDYPWIIENWRKKGYGIQVNKGSFLGRFGKNAEVTAQLLLEQDRISVVASDAHGAYRRTPCLLDAYDVLSEKVSEEMLKKLFYGNPARICMDQEMK